MRKHLVLLAIASSAALLCACPRAMPPVEVPPAPDILAWVEQNVEHDGAEISLGFCSRPAADPTIVEPIAAITHSGAPVASAMVFAQLVSADGQQVLSEEIATRYRPATDQLPALYEGRLRRLAGTPPSVLRFRIVLAESEADWVRDIPIP